MLVMADLAGSPLGLRKRLGILCNSPTPPIPDGDYENTDVNHVTDLVSAQDECASTEPGCRSSDTDPVRQPETGRQRRDPCNGRATRWRVYYTAASSLRRRHGRKLSDELG